MSLFALSEWKSAAWTFCRMRRRENVFLFFVNYPFKNDLHNKCFSQTLPIQTNHESLKTQLCLRNVKQFAPLQTQTDTQILEHTHTQSLLLHAHALRHIHCPFVWFHVPQLSAVTQPISCCCHRTCSHKSPMHMFPLTVHTRARNTQHTHSTLTGPELT